MGYLPEMSRDFGVAVAELAGELTGLLLAAVSIKSDVLGGSRSLASRAAQTLVLFITPRGCSRSGCPPRPKGTAENRTKDEEAAMVRTIDRDEVWRLMERGAQIVDVLPAREYGEDHLPGAVNLPLRKIEAEALRVLDPSRPVVVYCADPG
jgi:hypothetical protein